MAGSIDRNRLQGDSTCPGSPFGRFFFWRNSGYEPPTPEPNFSGYYEGPWVNKNGDLVSGDGKIIKQGYGVPAGGPARTTAQARRMAQNPVLSSGLALEP